MPTQDLSKAGRARPRDPSGWFFHDEGGGFTVIGANGFEPLKGFQKSLPDIRKRLRTGEPALAGLGDPQARFSSGN
jgi:hypothetical protein